MLPLLASLAWCAVAVYAVRCARECVFAWLESTKRPELPAQSSAPSAVVEVPEDLVALAMVEREPWAQEDVLKAVRERYDLLRDWNLVRSAFGIGKL